MAAKLMEGRSTAHAALAAGVTYRQADWWARQGLLRPVGGDGSGSARKWAHREVQLMWLLGQLALLVGRLPESVETFRQLDEFGGFAVWQPGKGPVAHLDILDHATLGDTVTAIVPLHLCPIATA